MSAPLWIRPRIHRYADLLTPRNEWNWSEFEKRVTSALRGKPVHVFRTADLQSGEVSGAAVWSVDRTSAIIVVPEQVGIDLQIRIAGHEAYHLLEEHQRCNPLDRRREAEAEHLGRVLGLRVRDRSAHLSEPYDSLSSAFGIGA